MTEYPELQIRVGQVGNDCIVELLRDSLLHDEAPHIARGIVGAVGEHAEVGSRVVVDFARVEHMNSNAVSVLLLATDGFRLREHDCVLIGVSEPIRGLLKFMCLGDHFTFLDRDQVG